MHGAWMNVQLSDSTHGSISNIKIVMYYLMYAWIRRYKA